MGGIQGQHALQVHTHNNFHTNSVPQATRQRQHGSEPGSTRPAGAKFIQVCFAPNTVCEGYSAIIEWQRGSEPRQTCPAGARHKHVHTVPILESNTMQTEEHSSTLYAAQRKYTQKRRSTQLLYVIAHGSLPRGGGTGIEDMEDYQLSCERAHWYPYCFWLPTLSLSIMQTRCGNDWLWCMDTQHRKASC
eukprot:1156780-Pelagomonas_calceolata.AAC.3